MFLQLVLLGMHLYLFLCVVDIRNSQLVSVWRDFMKFCGGVSVMKETGTEMFGYV